MAGNQGVTKENIDEVILRLLKLKSGMEMDYQTYAKKLKTKLTSSRMVGVSLPAEEDKLLREEFKRVRNKEGRFLILKVKKTRISSPPPPPSNGSGGGGTPPKTSSIVKSKSGKVTADRFFYQNFVQNVTVKDVTEKASSVSKDTDSLSRISNLLDSIIQTLTDINSFDREQANKRKIEAENSRRAQRESQLESKSFDGIKNALSSITKPFQSIWDKIINFITNVILGRIVIKLIDWIGDPKNQQKIQSIIRFLGDHWPTLLALYLRFGTGIGKFVGSLSKVLVRGTFKLVKLTASLAAKAGLKGAGKFSRFLGSGKGRAIATGVSVAADVAITAGTAFGISKLFGGGENKNQSEPPTQQFSGGGFVKIPGFSGGGYANFNKIFGNATKGASIGSLFGPMGMLIGAGLGASSGVVKGPKGRDRVPAMLTDGEFVMSVGAVNKYGIDTLEAMNAAGGGTNQPKVVGGKTYAEGGGSISKLRSATRRLTPDVADKIRTQKFTTLWHGTNDIYKRMIETGGIDPKKYTFGALGEGFYTTTDKKIARLYADQAASLGGGKPAMVRLQVPTDILRKYTADLTKKGLQLSGNELIQYSKIRPSIGGNTHTGPMHVWGGRGQITPQGAGPRIGKVGKGGLSMRQQYAAANLANKFGRPGASPSIIRSSQAPQRWMDKFVSKRQPAPTTLKPRIPTLASQLSPSYFLRGQSSLLPENYFLRGQSSRLPTTQTSSFNRYRPGATIRATGPGMERFPELQRFANQSGTMRPRAIRGRSGGGLAGTVAMTLAELFAPQIQSGVGQLYNKMGIGMGNLSDKDLKKEISEELKMQKGLSSGPFGNILNKDSERLALLQQEMNRRKNNALKGGAIKGGYKLTDQSFKDAPKTQVMTDDKGRPFVGHKAMRNGKLVYVRGPHSQGTSNPLEALGRMVNPNAYKENDARISKAKKREAMVNSLESLRARGASVETQKRMMKQMGGNLKDVENDLNYRKKTKAKIASGELKPDGRKRTGQEQMRMKISKSQKKKTPPKQKPKKSPKVVKYNPAGGGMGGRRGSGARPSTGSKAPSFSSKHGRGTSANQAMLGIKK